MILLDQVFSISPKSMMQPRIPKEIYELNEPLVVISFDDATETDYTIAYPELKKRGLKGTSYVTTSFVGRKGYLSWDQLRSLSDDGWDIQCHSYQHLELPSLSDEELRYQMERVNTDFLNNGLERPKHHAYPRGLTNERVQGILSEYRKTLRQTGAYKQHLNSYESIDPLALKAVSIDNMTSIDDLSRVKEVITYGYHTKRIIILYGHQIVEKIEDYPYVIRLEYFLEILDHINYLGLESVTISEMYERVFSD